MGAMNVQGLTHRSPVHGRKDSCNRMRLLRAVTLLRKR